jgi:hypothetical protein
VYRDPETENEYVYLTTLKNIEPGLIAHLYLHRWKIEKVFDVFKNKFYEQKAWADGEVSADIQASAVAMAYNILLRKQDVVLAEERDRNLLLKPKDVDAVEQGLPSCQLYHLERDPGETTNLIHSEPEMAKEMTQLLHRCVAQGRSTPGGTAANHHGGPSLENWDQINWLPEIPEQYILDD